MGYHLPLHHHPLSTWEKFIMLISQHQQLISHSIALHVRDHFFVRLLFLFSLDLSSLSSFSSLPLEYCTFVGGNLPPFSLVLLLFFSQQFIDKNTEYYNFEITFFSLSLLKMWWSWWKFWYSWLIFDSFLLPLCCWIIIHESNNESLSLSLFSS